VKKIDKTKRLYNVEDSATLDKLLNDFNKMWGEKNEIKG
jgi:hypothetical protein